MTTLLTRALQALERALEDSHEVINTRVQQLGEVFRPRQLQKMRDDLAAGERVAEELRAAVAASDPMPLVERLREASAGTEEWQVVGENGGIMIWFNRSDSPDPEQEARQWLRKHQAEGHRLGHRVVRATVQDERQGLLSEAADEIERLTAALASAAPAQGVPAEITGEMWSAGRFAFMKMAKRWYEAETGERSSVVCDIAGTEIFRAMLAATPPAPPPAQSAWMPIEGAPRDGQWRLVPAEPTPAMVDAYLKANDAYWRAADEIPPRPDVWRTGTPKEATAAGYRAMLAAAPPGQQTGEVGRQPLTDEQIASAVADERERCAVVAEGASKLPNAGDMFANGWCSAAIQIAQAIRQSHIGTAPTTGARDA